MAIIGHPKVGVGLCFASEGCVLACRGCLVDGVCMTAMGARLDKTGFMGLLIEVGVMAKSYT